MNIKKATINELEIISSIVHNTIKAIYPNYYPLEVVDYFLMHHNGENIKKDLENGFVYLLSVNNQFVGTGSIDRDYIGRVYVLPQYQGKGYGSIIMNLLEEEIFKISHTSYLTAALPSHDFYLKRGYHPTEYHKLEVENHRVLCYYDMEKTIDGTLL